MQITQISGCTFVAETETTIHPLPSHGTEPIRTEHPQRKTGRLAFLEVENYREKERIRKTLESVVSPLFPSVRTYEEGFVLWVMDSTPKEQDVFADLCEAAQRLCKSQRSRFYSAEQFRDLNGEAFAEIVKGSTGLNVSPVVMTKGSGSIGA